MGQSPPVPPCVKIKGAELDVLNQFQYVDSNATDDISLDAKHNKDIRYCHLKNLKKLWENKWTRYTLFTRTQTAYV